MVLELRDILYFFMGVAAVLLVASFSAYELSTYDSVRGVLGSIVTDTSQGSTLHSQYNDMADQFANNRGDVFTYRCAEQPIDVTAMDAKGKSESQVISLVLDKFAEKFYHGNVKGNLATLSNIAGAGANGLYFLVSVLLFAVFLIIFILSYIQKWYDSTRDMLRSSGKIILVMGILAFVAFLFMPTVVKSVIWGSISSDLGRDVTHVVEPRITGTFLVNTLITILFGALLYGAGFLIHINTGEGEPNPMEYVRSAPKIRQVEAPPKVQNTHVAKEPSEKPGHRQL